MIRYYYCFDVLRAPCRLYDDITLMLLPHAARAMLSCAMLYALICAPLSFYVDVVAMLIIMLARLLRHYFIAAACRLRC